MTRPVNPITDVVAARDRANRTRGEWLTSVAEGLVTVTDVIEAACREDGRPLMRVRLRQLLLAQPGWGTARTDRHLHRLLSLLRIRDVTAPTLTIGWLVDARAGGRRVMAWCDLFKPKDGPPWPGYPFRQPPQES